MVEEEGGPRVLRNLRTDAEFASRAGGDVREHDVDVFVVGQLVVEIGI
jgi:predicted nucleotidyltransferase